MTRFILALLFGMAIAVGPASSSAGTDDWPDPEVLLRQADVARGGADGVEWTVETLYGRDLDNLVGERVVRVVSKGYWSLITTIGPETKVGEQALNYKGSVWLYRNGLRGPVPASSRQRMLGNLSYGDIASVNYAEDYDVVSMDQDILDNEECWVIDLVASSKDIPFDKVRYWISKERKLGIKTEFFAVSGRKLKSAEMEYQIQESDRGRSRPFISEVRIRDFLVTEPNIAVIKFSAPVFREVSEDELRIKLSSSVKR